MTETTYTELDLGNGFSVEADGTCWALTEKRVTDNPKTGKKGIYEKKAYYPSLEYALVQFVDIRAKTAGPSAEGVLAAKSILAAISEAKEDIHRRLEAHIGDNGSLPQGGRVLDRKAEEGKKK